jgi:hypothetical protein
MESKHESAKLIMKLYDLRREETMRKARDWFFRFNPTSVEEIRAVLMGPHSNYFRMVVSYWDMAASFVNHGAIDEEMFNDANGEHVGVFAKIQPHLAQFRAEYNLPKFAEHLEQLVMRMPNAEERLAAVRERLRKVSEELAKAAGE